MRALLDMSLKEAIEGEFFKEVVLGHEMAPLDPDWIAERMKPVHRSIFGLYNKLLPSDVRDRPAHLC